MNGLMEKNLFWLTSLRSAMEGILATRKFSDNMNPQVAKVIAEEAAMLADATVEAHRKRFLSEIDTGSSPDNIDDLIRNHLFKVLARNDGHRVQTAKDMGVGLRTVRNWITKFRSEGFEIPDSVVCPPKYKSKELFKQDWSDDEGNSSGGMPS